MRFTWMWLVLVLACGKGTNKSADPGSAAVTPSPGSGSAAPADAGGAAAAVLDDSVAIVDDWPCKTDCKAKCDAKQASACIRQVLAGAGGEEAFAARCDAGDPMGCENQALHVPAEAAKWNDKKKAALAALVAACDAGDPWACMYAAQATPDHLALEKKACKLGLARACVAALLMAKPGPETTAEARHFVLMYGRACKEAKDPKPCGQGARKATEYGDTAGAEALRKRGVEVASPICAGDDATALLACAWQAALADALGDKASADTAFARAVKLADTQCKAGKGPSCHAGAALHAGNTAVSQSPIEEVYLPDRFQDLAAAKPLLTEACRLQWRADPKTEPISCVEAEAQEIDIAKLVPPGGKRRPPGVR